MCACAPAVCGFHWKCTQRCMDTSLTTGHPCTLASMHSSSWGFVKRASPETRDSDLTDHSDTLLLACIARLLVVFNTQPARGTHNRQAEQRKHSKQETCLDSPARSRHRVSQRHRHQQQQQRSSQQEEATHPQQHKPNSSRAGWVGLQPMAHHNPPMVHHLSTQRSLPSSSTTWRAWLLPSSTRLCRPTSWARSIHQPSCRQLWTGSLAQWTFTRWPRGRRVCCVGVACMHLSREHVTP